MQITDLWYQTRSEHQIQSHQSLFQRGHQDNLQSRGFVGEEDVFVRDLNTAFEDLEARTSTDADIRNGKKSLMSVFFNYL